MSATMAFSSGSRLRRWADHSFREFRTTATSCRVTEYRANYTIHASTHIDARLKILADTDLLRS
jgi:kynurenine formamidase